MMIHLMEESLEHPLCKSRRNNDPQIFNAKTFCEISTAYMNYHLKSALIKDIFLCSCQFKQESMYTNWAEHLCNRPGKHGQSVKLLAWKFLI